MLKAIVKGFVWIYRVCISPFIPHVCKFKPTCSKYMLETINKFGVFKGVWLGIKRIFRCNPKSKCRKDLPLENLKGDYKWVM